MRQPLRAIVRWTALEVLVVQMLGAWLGRQLLWPVAWPASWAVYTLAGREGSRQGRFRYAPLAGGAVAVVAHIVSAVRIALNASTTWWPALRRTRQITACTLGWSSTTRIRATM